MDSSYEEKSVEELRRIAQEKCRALLASIRGLARDSLGPKLRLLRVRCDTRMILIYKGSKGMERKRREEKAAERKEIEGRGRREGERKGKLRAREEKR